MQINFNQLDLDNRWLNKKDFYFLGDWEKKDFCEKVYLSGMKSFGCGLKENLFEVSKPPFDGNWSWKNLSREPPFTYSYIFRHSRLLHTTSATTSRSFFGFFFLLLFHAGTIKLTHSKTVAREVKTKICVMKFLFSLHFL